MTISNKQLEQVSKASFERGKATGEYLGKEAAKKELLATRQAGVVEISRAAADLAMANAKLTYALSRITDKLL